MNIKTSNNLSTSHNSQQNMCISDRNYPNRIKVDENILELSHQKEARCHALTSWYCVCNVAINHVNATV